jgi:hypothetical protein
LSDSTTDEKRRESVQAQLRSWASLRRLHPAALDFERLTLIRNADRARLGTPEGAAQLVRDLGLNDEGAWEFPEALHPYFGGLRIWQYPEQFGPYLQHVARLGVKSYLEIGIRHGGSFLATIEYLQRWSQLSLAVGVDLIRAPGLAAYTEQNPHVKLWWLDSRSEEFKKELSEQGPFDLVFLDSHHEEGQCRAEVELLSRHAKMIALHDITNVGWPGVAQVWREMVASPQWECVEFTSQYEGLGPFMGIGLAIRREGSV